MVTLFAIILNLTQVAPAPPDQQALKPEIRINGGDAFTSKRRVSVEVVVDSGAPAPASFQYAVTPDRWTEWAPFQARFEADLTEGDGPKVIAVRLRDAQGRELGTASSSIILDTTAPTVAVLVRQLESDSAVHVVKVEGEDVVGVQMETAADSWGPWRPFVTPMRVLLPSPGLRARFRDQAGNVTEPIAVAPGIDVPVLGDSAGFRDVSFWVKEIDAQSLELVVDLASRDLVRTSIRLDQDPAAEAEPFRQRLVIALRRTGKIRRVRLTSWDAKDAIHEAEIRFHEDEAPRHPPMEEAATERPSPWKIGLSLGFWHIAQGLESNTANGQRTLDAGLAATTRLSIARELAVEWRIGLSVEYAIGSRSSFMTGILEIQRLVLGDPSVDAGWSLWVNVGLLYSTISFQDSEFGDLDPGLGADLRVLFETPLGGAFLLQVEAGWRVVRLDWAEEVTSGDSELKGDGALLSIGVTRRF